MSLKSCYSAAGGDYDDVMRRFLYEVRVDRFLGMFLRDENFERLCAAMEARDPEAAFRAVHTLKGICMNLSLTELAAACTQLTEDLRGRQMEEEAQQDFAKVRECYLRTSAAVREHLEGLADEESGR